MNAPFLTIPRPHSGVLSCSALQSKLTAGERFDLEAEAAPDLIPFLTGNSLIVELGQGSLANSQGEAITVRFCRQASAVEICGNGERLGGRLCGQRWSVRGVAVLSRLLVCGNRECVETQGG